MERIEVPQFKFKYFGVAEVSELFVLGNRQCPCWLMGLSCSSELRFPLRAPVSGIRASCSALSSDVLPPVVILTS